MQIRCARVMLFLVTTLASPAMLAIGGPWSGLGFAPIAPSERGVLLVVQAPVGHRQPTLEDLPDWLRDTDGPVTEGSKPSQRHSPAARTPLTANTSRRDERHVDRPITALR